MKSISKKEISTLVEQLGTNNKRAINELARHINNGNYNVNFLYKMFFTSNDLITYDIIQLLCTTGNDGLFLEWFWEFYQRRYLALFRSKKINSGFERIQMLIRVVSKYFAKETNFNLIVYHLVQVKQQSDDIRGEILDYLVTNNIKVKWRYLRYDIKNAFPDYKYSYGKENAVIDSQEITLAKQIEFDGLFEETAKKKELYHHFAKISYSGFFIQEFFAKWVKEGVFTYDQVIIFDDEAMREKVACRRSTSMSFLEYMVERIKETPTGLQRAVEFTNVEEVWMEIQSNAWYKGLSFADFKNHLMTKKLYALISLAHENVFMFFHNHIATQYTKGETSQIYDMFRQVYLSDMKKEHDRLRRDWLFEMGNRWETICVKIAKYLYGDILLHPRLMNGSVPDIAINQGVVKEGEQIAFAETIIECKKSFNFTYSPNDHAPNHSLFMKYGNHCANLEFWILNESEYYKEPDIDNLTVRFGEDFLDDPSLPQEVKKEIEILLEVSNEPPDAPNMNKNQVIIDILKTNLIPITS